MKERPILFSGPMVRAILKGRKTQTRRIVKLHPASQGWRFIECAFNCEDLAHYHAGFAGNAEFKGSIVCVNCPYGKPPDPIFKNPGDRLWVRETFCIESSREVSYDPPHSDGRPIRHHNDQHWGPWWEQPHYRATDPAPELDVGTGEPGCRWRPSIFMPRWASRITLEITGVRVERLQQISDADALAEGCSAADMRSGDSWASVYARLWGSIHGPGSWDANPWVWVVEFRRLPAGEPQP